MISCISFTYFYGHSWIESYIYAVFLLPLLIRCWFLALVSICKSISIGCIWPCQATGKRFGGRNSVCVCARMHTWMCVMSYVPLVIPGPKMSGLNLQAPGPFLPCPRPGGTSSCLLHRACKVELFCQTFGSGNQCPETISPPLLSTLEGSWLLLSP